MPLRVRLRPAGPLDSFPSRLRTHLQGLDNLAITGELKLQRPALDSKAARPRLAVAKPGPRRGQPEKASEPGQHLNVEQFVDTGHELEVGKDAARVEIDDGKSAFQLLRRAAIGTPSCDEPARTFERPTNAKVP